MWICDNNMIGIIINYSHTYIDHDCCDTLKFQNDSKIFEYIRSIIICVGHLCVYPAGCNKPGPHRRTQVDTTAIFHLKYWLHKLSFCVKRM